jgi:hypothetical protein
MTARIVPMLTINKMMTALKAILSAANNTHAKPQANLDMIWVITNETINEVEPEIAQIKTDAMAGHKPQLNYRRQGPAHRPQRLACGLGAHGQTHSQRIYRPCAATTGVVACLTFFGTRLPV